MVDPNLPHRRYNPLTGEWILVSPQRASRPWQGTIEPSESVTIPAHDPACFLCPGNTRTNHEKNPPYDGTFVFTNDHAALIPQASDDSATIQNDPLLQTQSENGTSRVVCYCPAHNRTMADLSTLEIMSVIDTWIFEYKNISSHAHIGCVQIFENKGALMGASSPHPHGQIWATEHVPTLVAREEAFQKKYMATYGQQLLLDYAARELRDTTRLLYQNDSCIIVVPYWATWPYETMILPLVHISDISRLTPLQQTDFAVALHTITSAYDKLFATPFPYSMGIHQSPILGSQSKTWQLHIHFYPPLLRSATVKKYFVGFEMFAQAQRDITAESAAKTLRELV